MKITILGSCSGTEPMPGRHHTSLALEIGDKTCFLDAGENCAYTSYLAGIDQVSTDSVFISHTHMDHIGGLPNLLWNIRKLCWVDPKNEDKLRGKSIRIFLPDLDVFEGIMKLLRGTEGNFKTVFHVEPHLITDGVLTESPLKVEAFHNYHLGEPAAGENWLSFSFELHAEGKKLVYSGDFKDLPELLPHMDGADLIFLETGHHRAFELCQELVDSGISFDKVMFYHHGLQILHDFDGELDLARQVLGSRVSFANDGTVIEL